MRKHFLTGLVFLLPIAISILIFVWVLDFLTGPFMPLAELCLSHLFQNPTLTLLASRVLVALFLIFLTITVGFLARKYIAAKALALVHRLFARIPYLRTIYSFSKEITSTMLSSDAPTFSKSVLIPFPQENSLALGLAVEKVPEALQKSGVDVELSVFVPTAPHPISGFLLLSSQKQTVKVDMTTEEVLKFLISCGTVPPEAKEPLS